MVKLIIQNIFGQLRYMIIKVCDLEAEKKNKTKTKQKLKHQILRTDAILLRLGLFIHNITLTRCEYLILI